MRTLGCSAPRPAPFPRHGARRLQTRPTPWRRLPTTAAAGRLRRLSAFPGSRPGRARAATTQPLSRSRARGCRRPCLLCGRRRPSEPPLCAPAANGARPPQRCPAQGPRLHHWGAPRRPRRPPPGSRPGPQPRRPGRPLPARALAATYRGALAARARCGVIPGSRLGKHPLPKPRLYALKQVAPTWEKQKVFADVGVGQKRPRAEDTIKGATHRFQAPTSGFAHSLCPCPHPAAHSAGTGAPRFPSS